MDTMSTAVDSPVTATYPPQMLTVVESSTFKVWFAALRDRGARARIAVRIRRLSIGNPGDAKPVGDGISELRIDHGPGYRVYFVRRGALLAILLCGGDKSTQDSDIAKAKRIAQDWESDQ